MVQKKSITLKEICNKLQENIMKHKDSQPHTIQTRFHDRVHVLEFLPGYFKLAGLNFEPKIC